LDTPSSVQSALAELVKLGKPIDFLLLDAGLVPFKKRVITADRGPSVPPGVGVRNRRLRAILRLGPREVLRPNPPPHPRHRRQLQTRLEEALESEKYEEAAKLRDEMKKLKQGGN
jgi:hypothetical protein